MYKTPYPLLRGVRDGTRCSSPFTVFSAWKRSSSCRHLNRAHVWPGCRGRGQFSRCSETWCSEKPHCSIYSIKNMGLFKTGQTSPSPMHWPRDSLPGHLKCTNQLCGPHRGFVSGVNKRPRVCTFKNTYLKTLLSSRGKQHPTPTQSGGQPVHLPLFPPFLLHRERGGVDFCLLWIDKARAKDKMYIGVSVCGRLTFYSHFDPKKNSRLSWQ